MTRTINDKRLDQPVDVVVKLASGNLSARLAASDARDSVDAVITGVHLFAEELDRVRRPREGERHDDVVAGDGVAVDGPS